ncbi:MAG TPA: hypothetical protein VIJ35_05620 [Bradyrhizobium sp.]
MNQRDLHIVGEYDREMNRIDTDRNESGREDRPHDDHDGPGALDPVGDHFERLLPSKALVDEQADKERHDG